MLEKQFITSALSLLFLGFSASLLGQKRYFDPQFGVQVKYSVQYGTTSSPTEKKQNLELDIYQPLNDTVKNRPLIILAHGGGFVVGNKNNYPMETLCSRFAQMGYVCASINYSMQFEKKGSANDLASKTVLRAMQDMKAAIRFFRASADSGNPYQINSNQIWVGGSSSGAITALHCAFAEDSYFKKFSWKLEDYGGFEGNGGHELYSSKVQGIISLSGAIGDTILIKKNIPAVSVHGLLDPIVPIGNGKIIFQFPLLPKVPPADVMGSKLVHQKLDNEGISNDLLVLENQGHVPFDKMLQWKHYPFYMDMTINFIRNFMYRELVEANAMTNTTDLHCSKITYERDSTGWRFYPVDKNIMKIKVFVYDKEGNKLQKHRVKKKRKSFYWKGKNLPDNFEMEVFYNGFRMKWRIVGSLKS